MKFVVEFDQHCHSMDKEKKLIVYLMACRMIENKIIKKKDYSRLIKLKNIIKLLTIKDFTYLFLFLHDESNVSCRLFDIIISR